VTALFFHLINDQSFMLKRSAPQELGFGKYIATSGRMMQPDGAFNVTRRGADATSNLYFKLITMPWPWFLGLMSLAYVLLNFLFASGYMLIGIDQLAGAQHTTTADAWSEVYFFSCQTLTTVGYGRISPMGFGANLLASTESFVGLLSFALISGLLYGRFSRPKAEIAFSRNLIVAPYKGGQALMFRMANKSRSELINTETQLLYAYNETDENGNVMRAFRALPLELSQIMFFQFSWTLVHAINAESLLYGLTEAQLSERHPEFFILVKAVEEANQQVVHTRTSYVADEMVWNVRFKPLVSKAKDGKPIVQLDLLSDYEMVE
jgi:inward rectifier potassium channel